MKYCVTILLRELQEGLPPCFHTRYFEANTVRDLNDWLFHHICNSLDSYEIINFYFEVVKE